MSSLSLSTAPSAPLTVQRVDARRLPRETPLTALAALLANIVVRAIAPGGI